MMKLHKVSSVSCEESLRNLRRIFFFKFCFLNFSVNSHITLTLNYELYFRAMRALWALDFNKFFQDNSRNEKVSLIMKCFIADNYQNMSPFQRWTLSPALGKGFSDEQHVILQMYHPTKQTKVFLWE